MPTTEQDTADELIGIRGTERFYAVCKKAGIEDAHYGGAVDIHALRGSFITMALEGGANPKAVQAIVGHSTLHLTMEVYAKATDRAKRDAASALPLAKVMPKQVMPVQFEHSARTTDYNEAENKAG